MAILRNLQLAEPDAYKSGDYYLPSYLLMDIYSNSGEVGFFFAIDALFHFLIQVDLLLGMMKEVCMSQ